jgi:hypothetical protein
MSLEEEIAINQFAQGVHSHEPLMARFSQLDEAEQTSQFTNLAILAREAKPTKSDVAQALLDSSLGSEYDPGAKIIKSWLWFVHSDLTDKDPIKAYMYLLYIYKAAYQRRFAGEKDKPASWLYQDLSKPETVQAILTRHQLLIEELYIDPSFRSELTTLARHWKRPAAPEPEDGPEAPPLRQTKFIFFSYQEIADEFINETSNKRSYGIRLLYEALINAFVKQFKVTSNQARRLTQDVVARHWQADDSPGLSL